MFGGEKRKLKNLYHVAQADRADVQLGLVLEQCDGALLTDEMKSSPYFCGYVVGMLDAVTAIYESETRKRIGLGLQEKFFVGFVVRRFGLTPKIAAKSFRVLAAEQSAGPGAAGIQDGYRDGTNSLMKRERPDRLRQHIRQAVAV